MLKQTIFWTGLISVVIGVVVTLVKRHRRARRRQDLPHDAGVRPAPLNADMSSPVSEVALADGDTIFFGGHGHQYRLVVE